MRKLSTTEHNIVSSETFIPGEVSQKQKENSLSYGSGRQRSTRTEAVATQRAGHLPSPQLPNCAGRLEGFPGPSSRPHRPLPSQRTTAGSLSTRHSQG